jgi:hypothetical protein
MPGCWRDPERADRDCLIADVAWRHEDSRCIAMTPTWPVIAAVIGAPLDPASIGP